MDANSVMTCSQCGSAKQSALTGEVAIHFAQRQDWHNPMLWVFPKLVICLQCGLAEFSLPNRELQVLALGASVEGAVICDSENQARPS